MIDFDPIKLMWDVGDLSYKLWPQQISIYKGIRALPDNIDKGVILCARQFGKSTLGVLLAIEDCLRNPEKCILIMAPTLKQAREIVTPRLKLLSQDAPSGYIRPSKSESKWYIGKQGSELVLGGFDINSGSQRGKTVKNIYIEEIVDSNPDNYIDSMRSDLGPALTHSQGGKMIFLTTLPKQPDHPFITETMEEARATNAFYSFTIDQNTKLTPEDKAACARRCGGENTIEYRREYMNEIVRDASILVVPNFDETIHVKEFDLPRYFLPTVSIDWGGVRDKTVALFHYYNFHNDTDEIIDELIFPGNTETHKVVAQCKILEEKYFTKITANPIHRVIDAPSALVVDLNGYYGFNCTLPKKDDWQAGINNMTVRFSQNKVLIHKRCQFLIRSCRSGFFNKAKTDFDRTRDLGHMDALAALMYGLRCRLTNNPYPKSHSTWFKTPHQTSSGEFDFFPKTKVFHKFRKLGIFKDK